QRARGGAGGERRADRTARQGAGPNCPDPVTDVPDLHQRPDRLVADHRRQACGGGRAAQAGQPERHLRSRTPQQAAAESRGATGEFMSVAHLNGSGSQPAIAAARTQAGIRISEVSKVFGRGASALLALDRLSLAVAPGEFVCLIGASGCGKSTLLNLVAGLDAPTSGEISTGGQRVALMFQEPALFPWLTA